MTWPCPSCGQEWPEKPFVDGTIGCPECGSISGPHSDDELNRPEALASQRLAEIARQCLVKWDAFPTVPGSRRWARNGGLALDELAARLSAVEQALEAYETAIDRHELWCGYRAEAPGDGSLNHARRLARTALAAASPVPEPPKGAENG